MSKAKIKFVRLTEVSPEEIGAHMNDPRVAEHMPLLTERWGDEEVARFIDAKERHWREDGLGHWAILDNNRYVGWGGFQLEGDEWDYGLVLIPDSFGLGPRITKQAIAFAKSDARIPYITFLLPPSRKNLGALKRNGAVFVGEVDYDGSVFRKYRLDTSHADD